MFRPERIVLPAGTVLEAQHVALAAALGLTELAVRRRLKVAIFSTGDEVVEPGSARGAAAIFDSNRVLLTELLERLGAVVTDLGILADDPDKLSASCTRRPPVMILSLPPAAFPRAKPILSARRWRVSATSCSGALR